MNPDGSSLGCHRHSKRDDHKECRWEHDSREVTTKTEKELSQATPEHLKLQSYGLRGIPLRETLS